MFRERSVYLADVIFQYILTLRNLNASCQQLSMINVLRTSMTFPDTKSDAYSRFVNANDILWPPGGLNPPGDHTTLFVEATASMATRKSKRSHKQFEEDGAGSISGAIRRRR
jgi:hypothetical protein